MKFIDYLKGLFMKREMNKSKFFRNLIMTGSLTLMSLSFINFAYAQSNDNFKKKNISQCAKKLRNWSKIRHIGGVAEAIIAVPTIGLSVPSAYMLHKDARQYKKLAKLIESAYLYAEKTKVTVKEEDIKKAEERIHFFFFKYISGKYPETALNPIDVALKIVEIDQTGLFCTKEFFSFNYPFQAKDQVAQVIFPGGKAIGTAEEALALASSIKKEKEEEFYKLMEETYGESTATKDKKVNGSKRTFQELQEDEFVDLDESTESFTEIPSSSSKI